MAKSYNDPNEFLNSIVTNNPNLQPYMKNAVDYINSNGGDAKTAFYKLMQNNGIDPNSISQFIKR